MEREYSGALTPSRCGAIVLSRIDHWAPRRGPFQRRVVFAARLVGCVADVVRMSQEQARTRMAQELRTADLRAAVDALVTPSGGSKRRSTGGGRLSRLFFNWRFPFVHRRLIVLSGEMALLKEWSSRVLL